MIPTVTAMISAHTARIRNGFLDRAIKSVLSQTHPVDAIVVALDHAKAGAAPTKQRALEMVTTDFVAVLDSDDEWLTNHIHEHIYAQIETGADIVYSWFETVPAGLDPFPEFFCSAPWDPEHPRHMTTTIMARTDMMKQVGYSAAEGNGVADDDWRMTLGLLALGAKVHHIQNTKTWLYHMHGWNSSGRGGQGDAK